jgi:uncharacterized protein (DUF1330 family)
MLGRIGLLLAGGLVLATSPGGLVLAQSKTPVYVVIEVDQMSDPEAFGKAVSGAPALPAGARYVVRSNKLSPRDGAAPPIRLVIIQFDSTEAAKAWTESVKAVDEARLKFTKSRSFVVEGFVP